MRYLLLALLLTSCTMGAIAPSPTPLATATLWSTNMPTASYTLTADNISPTHEVFCVLAKQQRLVGTTWLYANAGLTIRATFLDNTGIQRPIDIPHDSPVELMTSPAHERDYAYQVLTSDGYTGWIPSWHLKAICK